MAGKENIPRGSFVPHDFNGSIEDYISLIYDHQKLCQKQGKYIEADLAKKKLVELKTHLQDKAKDEVKNRHRQESSEVENAHLLEFGEFNKYWDVKIQEYEEEAMKIDEQIRERHAQEMESFKLDIQKSLGLRPKQTPEMINLRKVEENLAKIQNYQQAHQVQQKILELERVQLQKWSIAKSNKIKNLANQLQLKQDNELAAIRQKIQAGYELEKKARTNQLQKLMQKYNNFMKQLQGQHNQEIIRLQKSFKNQSFLSASVSKTASNMSKALTIKNRNK